MTPVETLAPDAVTQRSRNGDAGPGRIANEPFSSTGVVTIGPVAGYAVTVPC